MATRMLKGIQFIVAFVLEYNPIVDIVFTKLNSIASRKVYHTNAYLACISKTGSIRGGLSSLMHAVITGPVRGPYSTFRENSFVCNK